MIANKIFSLFSIVMALATLSACASNPAMPSAKFLLPQFAVEESKIPGLDPLELSSEKPKQPQEGIPDVIPLEKGESLIAEHEGYFVSAIGMENIMNVKADLEADIESLQSRNKAIEIIADAEFKGCTGVLATYKTSAEFAVNRLADEVNRLNSGPGVYTGIGLGFSGALGAAKILDFLIK